MVCAPLTWEVKTIVHAKGGQRAVGSSRLEEMDFDQAERHVDAFMAEQLGKYNIRGVEVRAVTDGEGTRSLIHKEKFR